MAEQARQEETMTLDAFLKWDDGTDTRYELIDGRVEAMNPPLAPHARLLSRLVLALEGRMPADCGTYTVGGTIRPGDNWNYRIPDLTVSCRDSEKHWVEEPRIVCEILSPSTGRADRIFKLEFYQSLPSIEIILLIYVTKRKVTVWRRAGDEWVARDYIGSATLELPVVTSPIPLDELYAHLPMEQPPGAAGDEP